MKLSSLFSDKKMEAGFGSGLYEKSVQDENGFKSRIHLRVDQDGTGILWVNANESFYLNEAAAMMSWCLLTDKSDEDAKKILTRHFPKSATQAIADYASFSPKIQGLLDGTDSACDLCQSGISQSDPFSKMPSAPYRMDLALTYGCNNDCGHCYNEKSRSGKLLAVPEWKSIMQKIRDLGIPHIVFTGGEPTLYPGLLELVNTAEEYGLVSGLNTNGRALKDAELVHQLSQGKLDHIQITLESADATIHDAMVGFKGAWAETIEGIRNAVNSDMFVMTNSTLLRQNATEENIQDLLRLLRELGVETVGINALIYSGRGKDAGTGLDEKELPALLDFAMEECEKNNQRLIWYTPTQYCKFNPQDFGLGAKNCTAARYAMCIEPDGTVIPCQSWYEGLGNMLTSPWKKIWQHPLCERIRSRSDMPKVCKEECVLFSRCSGGCPLAAEVKSDVTPFKDIQDGF